MVISLVSFTGIKPAGFLLPDSITRAIKLKDRTNEEEQPSPSVWAFFEVDHNIEVVWFSILLDCQSSLSSKSRSWNHCALFSSGIELSNFLLLFDHFVSQNPPYTNILLNFVQSVIAVSSSMADLRQSSIQKSFLTVLVSPVPNSHSKLVAHFWNAKVAMLGDDVAPKMCTNILCSTSNSLQAALAIWAGLSLHRLLRPGGTWP